MADSKLASAQAQALMKSPDEAEGFFGILPKKSTGTTAADTVAA